MKYAALCCLVYVSRIEGGKLFKILIRGRIYSDMRFREILLAALPG